MIIKTALTVCTLSANLHSTGDGGRDSLRDNNDETVSTYVRYVFVDILIMETKCTENIQR